MSAHLSSRAGLRRLSARLLVAAGLIGLAGAVWGPWVNASSAGLALLGIDLAEYVKFLPDVRSGALPVTREYFYLPLFSLGLGLSLLAILSQPGLPSWGRLLLALLAIPCALALLPPAWSPVTFRQAEFRPQIVLLIAIVSVALLAPWLDLQTRPGWRRVLALALALLAPATTILPLWQWLRLRPAVETVYHHALGLGWGGWVLPLGGGLLLCGALLIGAETASDA